MLEHLTGVKALLWERAPAMALVLLSSAPSGCPDIVRCRDSLLSRIPMPNELSFGSVAVPSLPHVSSAFHSFPSSFLYIGFGHSDIQGRPSQWANPFYSLEDDGCVSLAFFFPSILAESGRLGLFLGSIEWSDDDLRLWSRGVLPWPYSHPGVL